MIVTTLFSRARLTLLTVGAALVTISCNHWRTAPEPVVTSLQVNNGTRFDVNVYAVPSPVAPPVRLGTVVSTSRATFTIRMRDLQPGRLLAVQVHAIGAIGSWTSDAVSVGEESLAVLDVSANAFGDCSTSMLYTVPKSEPQDRSLVRR